jgi:hypothetical protein
VTLAQLGKISADGGLILKGFVGDGRDGMGFGKLF